MIPNAFLRMTEPSPPAQPTESRPARKNRGRVHVIRPTAGRGGKVVTMIKGFAGIGLPEKERVAKAMHAGANTRRPTESQGEFTTGTKARNALLVREAGVSTKILQQDQSSWE
jgi:hypothetical protein